MVPRGLRGVFGVCGIASKSVQRGDTLTAASSRLPGFGRVGVPRVALTTARTRRRAAACSVHAGCAGHNAPLPLCLFARLLRGRQRRHRLLRVAARWRVWRWEGGVKPAVAHCRQGGRSALPAGQLHNSSGRNCGRLCSRPGAMCARPQRSIPHGCWAWCRAWRCQSVRAAWPAGAARTRARSAPPSLCSHLAAFRGPAGR